MEIEKLAKLLEQARDEGALPYTACVGILEELGEWQYKAEHYAANVVPSLEKDLKDSERRFDILQAMCKQRIDQCNTALKEPIPHLELAIAQLIRTIEGLQAEEKRLHLRHADSQSEIHDTRMTVEKLQDEKDCLAEELAELQKHLDLALPQAVRACLLEKEVTDLTNRWDQHRADVLGYAEKATALETELKELRAELIPLRERNGFPQPTWKAVKHLEKRLAEAEDQFATHTISVSKFLSEMYAIMVDPLAEGEIKVAETCAALLEAAKRDRELAHENEYLKGLIAAPTQPRYAKQNIALKEALVGLLELGRKDTSNPKYDGFYEHAKTLIKATTATNRAASIQYGPGSFTAALEIMACALSEVRAMGYEVGHTGYPHDSPILTLGSLEFQKLPDDKKC